MGLYLAKWIVSWMRTKDAVFVQLIFDRHWRSALLLYLHCMPQEACLRNVFCGSGTVSDVHSVLGILPLTCVCERLVNDVLTLAVFQRHGTERLLLAACRSLVIDWI